MTGGVWKVRKHRFKQWTSQKGFYTILLLCVVTVVGTSGVITARNLKKLRTHQQSQEHVDLDAEFGDFDLLAVDDMQNQEGPLSVTEEEAANTQAGTASSESQEEEQKLDFVLEVPENPEEVTATGVAKKEEQKETTQEETTEKEVPEQEVAQTEKEEEPVVAEVFYPYEPGDFMQWPVEGEVVMTFSPTKPIYDKTLEQFRTNSSISIGGPHTTQVRAAASGIVESITNHPQTGMTVVIDHGNGWRTTYGQLQEKVLVKEQERVTKGKVIGGIGQPTQYSVLLGEHLYFQVTKDGEPVDPSYLLPQ